MKSTQYLSLEKRFPLLGGGSDGLVFRLSATTVAKFPAGSFCKKLPSRTRRIELDKIIRKEYDICVRLYEGAVRVPKPIGYNKTKLPWIDASFDDGDELDAVPTDWEFFAFIMEYIPGTPIWKLKGDIRKKAHDSYDIELWKAYGLGYEPGDDMDMNAIWSPKKGGAVVIDFANWTKLGGKND